MRWNPNVIVFVFLLGSSLGFAKDNSQDLTKQSNNQEKTNKGPLSHLWLNALGIYTDFKFNSSEGTNYNLFKGYSKLASIGGNNVDLGNAWTAGLEIMKIDTILNSRIFISPGLPSKTHQNIQNNTLFGHLLKQLNPNWFLDFSGAYGSNKISTTTLVTLPLEEQIGAASSRSSNWFANIMGLYSKNWNNWFIIANGRLLYSQVNNHSYSVLFQQQSLNYLVAPLAHKAWYLMENVELGYQKTA